MPPRARPPFVRSVQTPESLTTLRTWLATLPARARVEGEALFEAKQVERVWAGADHYVEAKVTEDGERFGVTLFLTLGKWSSRCNCEERSNCKHAYAATLAWQAESESRTPANPLIGVIKGPTEETALATAPEPVAEFLPPPPKASFRAQWSPVLAKKIGRALTAAEDNQLENLAALFADFVQAHGVLYPGTLLRHGFEYTPTPGAPLYAPAFAGWWDRTNAPTDPWALWQFIAYHYESESRAIPEAFRPLTNTSSIRGAIDDQRVRNDLSAWQRALAVGDDASGPARTHPATFEVAGLRARVRPEGGLVIETRPGPGKVWRSPPQKWFAALATARPVDFNHLSAPEAALGAALAAECAAGLQGPTLRQPLPPEATANLFRTKAAREAIVMPEGGPLVIEPEPLTFAATVSPTAVDRLDLRLSTSDGRDASDATLVTLRPSPLYFFDQRLWQGPPPPPDAPLPTAALGDTRIMSRLRAVGLRLPAELESNVRRIPLRPRLKCWLATSASDSTSMDFQAQLVARADDLPVEQHWINTGWHWTERGAPPPRAKSGPLLEFDLSEAQSVSGRLAEFGLTWRDWQGSWGKRVDDDFPDQFLAWHASLPPGLQVDAAPGLANLLGPPLRAHVEFSAAPAEAAGRDWFNLHVHLRVSDTKLTQEEVALLMKARGKWVHLPKHGWRRLELERNEASEEMDDVLDRLGLDAADVLSDGKPRTHRIHALQLAAEADLLADHDPALAAAVRARAQALAAIPPPALPAGLRATLRPYQQEGYHFLAHLAGLGLGGILADDMGLGKTVQTLTWLLHLAENRPEGAAPMRALVVCPKSVTHGWLVETERFAPSLHALAYSPFAHIPQAADPKAQLLLVANYTQLRLNAAWFKSQTWDAVVLDEGQFIKNPSSQVASVARALPTKHRVVLTGTPIENRLSDLWSLFAFAQPGLLGTQTAFRRHYADDNPAAHGRLHRRVRHFLLRRTKAQAAPELPPRTEDDVVVELEGQQRLLYEAELKRARAQLLGVDTHQALAAVRFNVLSSLLRLRQICCHPALVDPAHRNLPSAKLEALMERLEELRDEGHQVLVFSQFVEMLEIIRDRLAASDIGHLILTGKTENRAELVDEFQRDRTKTVFLLSLKAAGFGLNLTAASYVILYDPWWNPAAEAQAIDRTHRIGQTQPVVAYRLLAENTVEEKIRVLQRDKAALAAAVVQEESLASILDLESLREIFS